MPDWQKFVRQRLAGLPLDTAAKGEVRAELAGHLEEFYEALRREGLSEGDAVQKTRQHVRNWPDLQHKIAMAKHGGPLMRKRLQQLWIPGLLSFGLATIFLMLLRQVQFQPQFGFWRGLSLTWLISLLCLGAFGAYLSSRAGGSRRTALVASLFPSLGLAFAFLFMFPLGFFLEQVIGWQLDFRWVSTTFLSTPATSLLIPATALLAGGLPTVLLLTRPTTRNTPAIQQGA